MQLGDFGPEEYLSPESELLAGCEVPSHLAVSPESGREVLVIGDVEHAREFNHTQGENSLGFQGTCGLVSCEDIIKQFGYEATEESVVQDALDRHLCEIGQDPESSGGTTMENQVKLLSLYDIPAQAEMGAQLHDLAEWVGEGRGLIIEVNAGEFWDRGEFYEGGGANHAVVVTGVQCDPESGEINGFYVNDSGRGDPEGSGICVNSDLMMRAWQDCGGAAVVTQGVRTA